MHASTNLSYQEKWYPENTPTISIWSSHGDNMFYFCVERCAVHPREDLSNLTFWVAPRAPAWSMHYVKLQLYVPGGSHL